MGKDLMRRPRGCGFESLYAKLYAFMTTDQLLSAIILESLATMFPTAG